MSTSETVVEVTDLQKNYGSFRALGGVSFDIRRGETFALLGPNGAGKSTTIEILEGFRKRSGGQARVLGVDPNDAGLDWKAQLGIVLQSSAEAANVTVREQVSQFAGYYSRPRDVDEVIEAVGLTAKAKTRIGKLSGGQRRRVDVALGVIGRPQLLFLDEPTTGFDPEARRQFWGLIEGLKADGTSILLTTHYLDEAAHLSDRVAVIAGGTLIDIGTVDEIGGAEARIPTVRWRDAAGVAHEERTTRPAERVAALYTQLGEPTEVEIVRPSLEDIYLDLVETDARARARAATETQNEARTIDASTPASNDTATPATGERA